MTALDDELQARAVTEPMRKAPRCSMSCRYFDAHSSTSKVGDCRALPGPYLRSIKVDGAVISFAGGHETKPGQDCPYDGPYGSSREYCPPAAPGAGNG